MAKKVRPYGSSVDAEYAALAKGRRGEAHLSELASTQTVTELADQAAAAVRALNDLTGQNGDLRSAAEVSTVIGSLELMAHGLPHLCEQLTRFLVAQGEDRQVSAPGYALAEVTESLTAAAQAADLLTAALDQARRATDLLDS